MSGDEVCREGERAGLCLGGEEEGKDVSHHEENVTRKETLKENTSQNAYMSGEEECRKGERVEL
ncbi:Hypothetical protein FKW44_014969, partial [Caligus rogercresseyi]